jgi:hypothetical protein
MTTDTSPTPRFFWFGETSEIVAAADYDQALEHSCYEFEDDEPHEDQWGELPADYALTMVETDEDERSITGEPVTRSLLDWYELDRGLPQTLCSAYN